MSTSVNVKIYTNDRNKGEELIQQVFSLAKNMEQIFEPLKGSGEVKKINSGSHEQWWTISPELKTVLECSFSMYEESGGAFDPTIGAVKWLWDFDNGGRIPAEDELSEALKTVGLSHVILRGDSLSLGVPGTKLDFGGVAKGYIVDRMITALKEGGATAGLVNAGGDICMFGKKPGGKDWVIGVKHPRNGKTMILKTVSLPAVATSGDYERFYIHNGVRYHHILNPTTGYPAQECASVTVWAKTDMEADILSTTIFVLGPSKGFDLAEKLPDVETLIFYEENGVVKDVRSSGVKDVIGE